MSAFLFSAFSSCQKIYLYYLVIQIYFYLLDTIFKINYYTVKSYFDVINSISKLEVEVELHHSICWYRKRNSDVDNINSDKNMAKKTKKKSAKNVKKSAKKKKR